MSQVIPSCSQVVYQQLLNEDIKKLKLERKKISDSIQDNQQQLLDSKKRMFVYINKCILNHKFDVSELEKFLCPKTISQMKTQKEFTYRIYLSEIWDAFS